MCVLPLGDMFVMILCWTGYVAWSSWLSYEKYQYPLLSHDDAVTAVWMRFSETEERGKRAVHEEGTETEDSTHDITVKKSAR